MQQRPIGVVTSHQLPRLNMNDHLYESQISHPDSGAADFGTNESSAPTNDQSLVVCRSPKTCTNSQMINGIGEVSNLHNMTPQLV